MRVQTIATATALLLAALPAAAQSNAEPYRASGTEPFWSLTIDGSRMLYRPADGRPVSVAKPRPIIGFNGERYVTRGMTVDITHVECSDGMRSRTFHDTVTVTLGRRTMRGCGGTVLSSGAGQQASLLDGAWSVEAIGGRKVARRSNPRVTFEGDRITGNASCNNFNGSFQFTRGRLEAGRLASTRMACVSPALNAQETRLLALLREPLSVSRNRAGKLVLTARNGQTLVLVRARR